MRLTRGEQDESPLENDYNKIVNDYTPSCQGAKSMLYSVQRYYLSPQGAVLRSLRYSSHPARGALMIEGEFFGCHCDEAVCADVGRTSSDVAKKRSSQ